MSDSDADRLRRSVVKLFTVVKEPDYYHPWELSRQHTSGGSACIIEGNRILTNAHVVAHHLHVQALKWGDTKKYPARVVHVDHDTETALLVVDDPKFFADTAPVRFGALPPRNAEVFVYGFPVGGNELCTTAGVVSRIEVRTYTHSQRSLLALQTDAAINPGNSGGPVFWNGELIGIAFQSYRRKDLERAGYVVPMPIIQHMFDDLRDGGVAGVPDLGVYWQKIENDALGAHLGLPDGASGVRVSRVLHGSSADGALEVDDVIAAIDGVAIASDGTVPLRDHDRVQFSHLVTRHHIGDRLALDVYRRGERAKLELTLQKYTAMVPLPAPDQRPSYFIFAGLVFTPLSYEYMHNWEWAKDHHRYAYHYFEVFPTPQRKQVVLIHEVLAHAINIGYHQVRGAIVERVNGVDITEMRDLVRAFGAPTGRHHVIETDYHGPRNESSDYHSAYGTRIVLDASRTAQATAEILAQNEIAKDRSADLK